MPTKKRRVGFIPRSDVLDIVNKLSIESNLSISKIINILVEEALNSRGIYSIKNVEVLTHKSKNNVNQHIAETNDDFIDKEIYTKFLMFLQFQERMKKMNK